MPKTNDVRSTGIHCKQWFTVATPVKTHEFAFVQPSLEHVLRLSYAHIVHFYRLFGERSESIRVIRLELNIDNFFVSALFNLIVARIGRPDITLEQTVSCCSEQVMTQRVWHPAERIDVIANLVKVDFWNADYLWVFFSVHASNWNGIAWGLIHFMLVVWRTSIYRSTLLIDIPHKQCALLLHFWTFLVTSRHEILLNRIPGYAVALPLFLAITIESFLNAIRHRVPKSIWAGCTNIRSRVYQKNLSCESTRHYTACKWWPVLILWFIQSYSRSLYPLHVKGRLFTIKALIIVAYSVKVYVSDRRRASPIFGCHSKDLMSGSCTLKHR